MIIIDFIGTRPPMYLPEPEPQEIVNAYADVGLLDRLFEIWRQQHEYNQV